MRIFCRLPLLCIFWLVIATVPSAADFSSHNPFCVDEDSLGTDQCSSDAQPFIMEEEFSDERSPVGSGAFILSQAEEPQEAEEDADYMVEEEEEDLIADPLEPVNRIFFHFNDKLYFWVLKPVARGYSAVIPEDIRIVIRNVFQNLSTPIRFVNNLLQLKIKSAGIELLRFGTNSIYGCGGLADVAKDGFGLESQDEDFGQTLGVWGLGPGFYINWPVLGPSSFRDTLGFAGDYFLDPINYVNPTGDRIAIKSGDRVNRTSLIIGEYEDLKEAALDPYTAVKDVYHQYRQNKISE